MPSRHHFPQRRAILSASLAIALGASVIAAAPAAAAPSDVSAYDAVKLWIGTQDDTSQNKGNRAYGNTWPGAALPFGMVQFTPTTYNTVTGKADGGYEYTADTLRGFGMTRLSGTGCDGRYSAFDLPLLPYTGSVNADGSLKASPGSDIKPYYLDFGHDTEQSYPGYYSVDLDNGVSTKLTATTRTTVGEFDYPDAGADSSTLLFNASGSNNNSGETQVTIDPDTRTISGYSTSKTVCAGGAYRIYFSSTYDQDFTSFGTWNEESVTPSDTTVTSSAGKDKTGAYVGFVPGSDVTVKTGVSYVSVANAAENAQEETAAKSFDQVRADAKQTWIDSLDTVDIGGGTADERTKFYTALYHSLLHPNTYDDVNGEYRAYGNGTTMTPNADVKTVASGHHQYVTYSAWDSFRGQMQLIALLFPKVGSDMAQSITDMALQTGHWYNWPHLGSGQNKMNGDSLQSIVASLAAFGSTDFDEQAALESMVEAESLPGTGSERSNLLYDVSVGWIEDRSSNATSTTLDYAMADFGIAQLAKRLGDDSAHTAFMTRAQNWQNLVDTTKNAIVPRDRKGYWSDFDLTTRSYGSYKPDGGASNSQFDQSTGLQYQWSVPFDVDGLINALGGKTATEQKLDQFFTKLDDSGVHSQYAYMSNQPSMHAPWIYNWLRSPAKATDILDRATSELFNTSPEGLPGNDDLGSLSSWYVWANIGLYPEIFGRSELIVSSPMFDSVTINSHGSDRTISISAPDATTHRYIDALLVDGTAQTKNWLPESFAQNGGTLDFTMSAAAGTWGTGENDTPPSFSDGSEGYNGTGTTTDGAVNAGSLDFTGHSLSRTQLSDLGATPGATIPFTGGITFAWPDSKAGEPDHWIPRGQSVDMKGAKASSISFLGLATNGPSEGEATVEYTDGTTAMVNVDLTDWTPGGSYKFENTPLLSTDYRNQSNGDKDTTHVTEVFATKAQALDPSKAIAAVILPDNVPTGIMHIFAIGTDSDTVYTPTLAASPAKDVQPGAETVLTGRGFAPNEAIKLSLGDDGMGTAAVDDEGNFTQSVTIPSNTADGSYTLTATGTVSSVSAEVSVTVKMMTTPPPYEPVSELSAQTVHQGGNVTVSGHGFAVDDTVTITLKSVPVVLATVNADADGTFSEMVTVPANAAVGAHSLIVSGEIAGAANPLSLTVNAANSVPPPSTPAPPGSNAAGLADTGSDIPFGALLAALALMMLGGLGLIIRRRSESAGTR